MNQSVNKAPTVGPKLAKVVTVIRSFGSGMLYLDGVMFPWKIGQLVEARIDPGAKPGTPSVRIELMAERVEIINSNTLPVVGSEPNPVAACLPNFMQADPVEYAPDGYWELRDRLLPQQPENDEEESG